MSLDKIGLNKESGGVIALFWLTMDTGTGHIRYELLSEVGEGAYGKVYKAREVEGEQRLLAVKKLNVRGEASGFGIPTVMIREVSLLMKMRFFNHPNIVG